MGKRKHTSGVAVYLDDKKEWNYKRKDLYRRILTSPLPITSRQRVSDHPKGIWETPKKFVDGYAYNDGTWLIYNTCRIKGSKFHSKVYCRTKKDVVEQLYSYMCFLKKVGVSHPLEMGYFAVCHIIWKLTFPKRMFRPSMVNLNKIEGLIMTVQRNDVTCDRVDTRQYCIDPKLKKRQNKGKVVGLQRKKDKEIRWNRIKELYDPKLTNQQNLDKMKDNGLDISESTLHRWKRGCQMVP